jgi:hemerythrin-like domain-containing protein
MNDTDSAVRTDTRDMIVVHTGLLREIRLAPAAVERAATARQRTRVARHVRLMLHILEHHHAGEDRLLLPLLRERVPAAAMGPVDTGEEQHARIEGLIAEAHGGIGRWEDGAGTAELSATLSALHDALEPHLRGEERDVLPLAAEHLTETEWQAIGEAGSAAVPKPAMLMVFGMFMYEGDPEVVASMLAHAPAPVRALLPRIAPRVYARHCRAVHGTDRP